MQGGVIKSDAVRHPIPSLDVPTRETLLRMARALDLIALKWGK